MTITGAAVLFPARRAEDQRKKRRKISVDQRVALQITIGKFESIKEEKQSVCMCMVYISLATGYIRWFVGK